MALLCDELNNTTSFLDLFLCLSADISSLDNDWNLWKTTLILVSIHLFFGRMSSPFQELCCNPKPKDRILEQNLSLNRWCIHLLSPEEPKSRACRDLSLASRTGFVSCGNISYQLFRSNLDGICRYWFLRHCQYHSLDHNFERTVMMLTTGHTTTTWMLSVFTNTTVTCTDMATTKRIKVSLD